MAQEYHPYPLGFLGINPLAKNNYIPETDVQIKVAQLKYPLKNGEDIPLAISLKNFSGTIPKGARIQISSPNAKKKFLYFFPHLHILPKNILQGETYSFKFLYEVTGAGKLSSGMLVRDVLIKIIDPKSKKLYKSDQYSFQFSIANFIGDLIDWRPARKLPDIANILVFGWVGAGKSTLVNLLTSLFLKSLLEVRVTRNTGEHVTQGIASVNLKEILQNDSINFRFWDTKGLTRDEYNDGSFEYILNGINPEKFSLLDTEINCEELVKWANLKSAVNNEANMIHSVILVMPQHASADLKAMARLGKIITELNDRHHNPILVVTGGDAILKENWRKTKEIFISLTGISSNRIFILDNNPENHVRQDFEHGKELLSILNLALKQANSFIYQNLQTYPLTNSRGCSCGGMVGVSDWIFCNKCGAEAN